MKALFLILLIASCTNGTRETGLGGMTEVEYQTWRNAQPKR